MSHAIRSFVLCGVVLIAACCRAPESKVELQEEKNKALIRREYEEVWNGGKPDVIDELYAPDWVGHMPGRPDIHGPESIKQMAGVFYAAFPDMQYTIADMVAEGDKVAVRWTLIGTHKGALMGVSPTGVRVTLKGNSILRFADGKCVELWSSFDSRVMWLQLGVAPPSGPSEE